MPFFLSSPMASRLRETVGEAQWQRWETGNFAAATDANAAEDAAAAAEGRPVEVGELTEEEKAQADALFSELGMNLSTAFNIFVRQSLREGGIPFEINLNQPNKETIAAMLEAERIAKDPSVKGYTDMGELFADLKK